MAYVPQITPTLSVPAQEIVGNKFVEMMALSETTYNTATDFYQDVVDFINKLQDVAGDVELGGVTFDATLLNDLLNMLSELPENPITEDDYLDIKIPTTLASFEELEYVSTLLTALRTKLISLVQGNADLLTATIEQDLIDSESERDRLINQEAIDHLSGEWAAMDSEMPDQHLFYNMAKVQEDYQNKRMDKSRDIRIDARKTAIDSIKHGIEESNKLEATRHEFWGKLNQRRLEAAKMVIDNALAIAEIGLKKLLAKAQVYEAMMRGYASKAQVLEAGANVEVALIKAKLEYCLAQADVAFKNLGIDLKNLELKYNVSLDALKTMLNSTTQLCASAIASVNASASLSLGLSNSVQASVQAAENWNHNLSS